MKTVQSGYATRRLTALVAILFCCAVSGWSDVIYVNSGASGGNSGASWADAYTDLQAALAAAEWGDEIWVAKGTYKPTREGDRNISFIMTDGAAIYGGFTGLETELTQRDWESNETILSGDIGAQENNSDNSYHVVVGGDQATLDGFIITKGNASYSGIKHKGGGMYNDRISLIVNNCTFSENSAGFGGGLSNYESSSTLTNCAFIGNHAGNGGGMYNDGSFPTLSNCTFSGNSATGDGGGIYGGSTLLDKCTFNSNSTGGSGGGVYYNGGDFPTLSNCTFSGNSATGDGGGMAYGSGTVTNCTFIKNTATYGGGMFNGASEVTNCIFWKNSATSEFDEIRALSSRLFISHCTVLGCGGSGDLWDPALGTDGGGNIMDDPEFVDIENPAGPDGIWMTADDGLTLGEGSPCIDAGDPANAPESDILGNSRINLPDIGAYEFCDSTPQNGLISWIHYH